jgi:N-acetyl-1-D-myo-inositol-2-amino-2-deoxy-alpha-D-glucopyranoside deacetylase
VTASSPYTPVLVFVATLLGGFLVGVVASVYHGAWFPLGLVAALAITTLFMSATRVLFSTRGPAMGAAMGLVTAIVVLAGIGQGGSVLIVANTAGWTFLAVVTLVTMIVLAWPSISPRPTSYDKEDVSSERIAPQ